MKISLKNLSFLTENKIALIVSSLVGIFLLGFFSYVQAANPTIFAVSSSSVTSVSAVITWTTDINSSSLVDFGLTTAYGSTSGDSGASVTSHSVILPGLSPGTTYRYRVRSTDAMGDQTIDDNGGAGYVFTTATAPAIFDVHLTMVGSNSAVITWQTSVNAYPYVAYGLTDSYGGLIGDESSLGTSHSISLQGLSSGTTYYYKPRVKDAFGNFTYYDQDNIFTTGAPYLQSMTSSTAAGTYGPASVINVTATYQDNLEAGASASVVLNTGVTINLNIVSGNQLLGAYAVGSTGSGQNNPSLSVSLINSQSVCNASYCYQGTVLPPVNIEDGSVINIDTTAPVFSNVRPINSVINSVTTSSDLGYTLSEGLSSGAITVSRTGGTADANAPYTCTFVGSDLNWGDHNNYNSTSCQEGAMSLVDGTTYTFNFNGQDVVGNNATQVSRSNVRFDTTSPVLESFTSSTIDGTYGGGSVVNITANYNESMWGGSMTLILDTGVVVNLTRDVSDTSTLKGNYIVGATGSGQNSLDLEVTTIVSQNVHDGAGNYSTGTAMPGTNISDGSEIIIDTVAPSSPGAVEFITDPVNSANVTSVTLRVDGEAGTTIHYSIDDTDPGTAAITDDSVAMEPDESTDITGINLSSLQDGTLTAVAYLEKANGDLGPASQDTVLKDTRSPSSWSMQYYSDIGLSSSLGDNPKLAEGTYYIRMGFSETLGAPPTITIDAQGTVNDVVDDTTTMVSGSTYRYARVISADVAANGTVLEDLLISSVSDVNGNTSTNINPAYEGDKSAYTDTTKPTVVGSVSPSNARVGTVNVSLVFDEDMRTSVAPTVILQKINLTTLNVLGSFSSSTNWEGTATISAGDANGVATLQVSGPQDVATNVMDANTNVNTFSIDTINPTVSVNAGTDEGPVQSDTVNIFTSDGGTGIVSQFYGFSPDFICNGTDTIDQNFTSNTNFTITGNNTNYLCTRVTDNAGNETHLLVGRLNVDNTAPTISSISSSVSNASYREGDVIDIIVNFSEVVNSVGNVAVTLETGTIDRACNFAVTGASFGTCNYTVQAGDISSDLNVSLVSGTINDVAGNTLTNYTPSANLATLKDITIDTVTPILSLISPLAGEAVNDSTTVVFSDTEITVPECSFDNVTWSNCISGTTTLSNIAGWAGLGEGSINLYIRDTDPAGNVGTDSEIGIIRDTNMPTVANVTSDKNNGSYRVGELIHITTTFSRKVTSTGSVIVTLETGSFDQACSFSITDALTGTCNYIVQESDNTNDLNVNSVSGTIRDSVGNALASTTPVINLADNKDIVIDTTSPGISSVTSGHSDGTFLVGERIDIQVNFSENVTSSGNVTVNLDSGGSCFFAITDSSTGTCDYFVGAGENSLDLTTLSITGTVLDQALNPMIDFTPSVNLGQTKNIRIDTTPPGAPTVVSVISDTNDGSYSVGEAIDIKVNFSEPVTSAGNVTVLFETGTIDRSCTFTISDAIQGECFYTVQEGDTSADLSAISVSGVIRDTLLNLLVNTTPAINLDMTKNIVIDTTAPSSPAITLLDPITDINKEAVTLTGTGEANSIINYSINDTNGVTPAITGTDTVSAGGVINITGINLIGLDGGQLTASVTLEDAAGNVGTAGSDTATSQVILPVVTSVTSSRDDGQYPLGEVIDIRVNFSENVTSVGDITVLLETGTIDRSCIFTVTNSSIGTCDYTIQAGDASNDLNVRFISGSLYDQADNPMVNFGLSPNLADTKDLVVDTTAPSAPTISITSIITDANKSAVTITGTGEANMTLNYSIDDANAATVAKMGTATVLGDGTISVSGIDLTGLDGGTITAEVFLTDPAGNIGGTATDTATSQIVLPVISSITSSIADNAYTTGEIIDIRVNFSENVTSSGNITVELETGTIDRDCAFFVTNSSVGICNYTVQDGDTSDDLNVISVSGDVADQAGNPVIDFTLNSNLGENKDIVIDTTNVTLINFNSSSPDNTYGPESSIEIIAEYSEPLGAGSTVTIDLNTGATITLDTIANNIELRGTYNVGIAGSGEGTLDLSVSTISSQNACDLAGNCLINLNLPSVNIADNSEIAVDAVSPVFSEVLPENSTNIESITSDSEISFTLSEDLASGRILITRTAWAEDLNSPHTCTLAGTYLDAGEHSGFDTTDCAFGGITLASGSVYSFSFVGQDAYGNISNEVLKTGVSYGLDLNPPVISDVTIEDITAYSATVTWTTDENSNSLVDFGATTAYGNTRGNSFASETSHSVSLEGLSPGTAYEIRVRSVDITTNEGFDDNGGQGHDLMTSALPFITSSEVTDTTFNSARISWTTDASVYSYLSYGETDSYGRAAGDDTLLVDNQSVLLEDLEADQEYHYQIKIRDIYGNLTLGGDQTFTTGVDPSDRVAPIISDISISDILKNGATVHWTTDESADSFVEYGVTTDYGERYGRDVLTDTHSIVLPALLEFGTLYHFRVISADANSNTSISEDFTFTTANSDGTGGGVGDGVGVGTDTGSSSGGDSIISATSSDISLSSIKVSKITSSSAVVTWKTDEIGNGLVRYGLDDEYGQSVGEDLTIDTIANFKKDHEVVITGLLSNTTYHYRVASYDQFGNITISSDGKFETGNLSSVSGVSVSNITLSSVTITWETGDPVNSELDYGTTTSYGRNVKDEKVSNYHKIELEDLAVGQTYHFRVQGKNEETGTISSDDYVFATYPEPKVENYEVGEISDSGAVVKWVTNVPTESSVDYSNPDDPEEKGVQGQSEISNEHEVKILGLKQGTEYEVKVKGVDINRNTFESESFKIKTDIDLTSPMISRVSSKASLANQKDDIIQAIIFWKTDEPATSQILFDIGMGGETLGQQSKMDTNLTTNHLVVLTDLRPGTVYRFRSVSQDENENSQKSDVFSLLTPKKEKSVFQLILANFEQTFGWMKRSN